MQGYRTVPEAETQIVKELVERLGPTETGLWIRRNYFKFKQRVGERVAELESDIHASQDEVVVFDRSAICYIAYCALRSCEVPPVLATLANRKEPAQVFFLTMLPSFDERSATGRIMKRTEAERLSKLIQHEYTERGHHLTYVPEFDADQQKNIQARLKQILEQIL